MIGAEQRLERRDNFILQIVLDALAIIERRFARVAFRCRRPGAIQQIAARIHQRNLLGRQSGDGGGPGRALSLRLLTFHMNLSRLTSHLSLVGWGGPSG